MVRIAHISDLHLLEADHRSRRGVRALRLSVISAHRALDADDRVTRARQALAAAHAAGVDHVVITGDITEDGTTAQFELFAELLQSSGLAPSRVTLVPGNHDLIDREEAWARALEGPLRAFRDTSPTGEDVVVGDVALVPLNTAFYQHWLFSAGRLGPRAQGSVDAAVDRHRRQGRALVLVQHHPVTAHPSRVVQWVDGLRDHARVRSVLDEEHVHVIHGHIHRSRDRAFGASRSPQVFCARAVVDGDDPVRVYASDGGALRAA